MQTIKTYSAPVTDQPTAPVPTLAVAGTSCSVAHLLAR